MLSAAQAVPLSGVSEAVHAAPAIYCGFAVVETGGVSPATVRVYDNAAAPAGTLIDAVDLVAGESASRIYDRGTWCHEGIWVELGGAGAVEGSVRVA
jgi:hypothetical protein